MCLFIIVVTFVHASEYCFVTFCCKCFQQWKFSSKILNLSLKLRYWTTLWENKTCKNDLKLYNYWQFNMQKSLVRILLTIGLTVQYAMLLPFPFWKSVISHIDPCFVLIFPPSSVTRLTWYRPLYSNCVVIVPKPSDVWAVASSS